MRRYSLIVAIVLASTVIVHAPARAAPPVVESRVISAGLFKNGLAVLTREVQAPQANTFLVLDMPDAVHGTFWIDSDAPVTVRTTSIDQPGPALAPSGNLQHDLAGRRVKIKVHGEQAMIDATVVEFPVPEQPRRWDRNYNANSRDYYPQPSNYGGAPAQPRFIVLDTAAGRKYLDANLIESIDLLDGAPPATTHRPALEFAVGAVQNPGRPAADASKPVTIRITCLVKGLCWSPAYRVDLNESARLNLRQQAVVRNELEDLTDVEMFLITGYPNIEFANVDSPLSSSATLAGFFRQLAAAASPSGALVNVQSQTVAFNRGSDDFAAVAVPSGEGVDVHYQSVGRRTLRAGEALAFDVAGDAADYKRVVEWIVPDTRDEWGRQVDRWQREHATATDPYGDEPWDAITFRNPFSFPMTSAPATIVDHGRFAGQCASDWTAAGDEASLRVNRALSVRGMCGEQEDEGERIVVNFGGREFRKVKVKGEVMVSNSRNEPVDMVIRRRFSGQLQEAEGSPASSLREEGVYSVNRRNELTWRITLKPGEQRTLTYRYEVLVYH